VAAERRSGVIARMFIYRPRNMSAVQSEMHHPASPEEAEVEAALGPANQDGGEIIEEGPVDGNESEPEVESDEVGVPASQPQLTRSQKRRKHRK